MKRLNLRAIKTKDFLFFDFFCDIVGFYYFIGLKNGELRLGGGLQYFSDIF